MSSGRSLVRTFRAPLDQAKHLRAYLQGDDVRRRRMRRERLLDLVEHHVAPIVAIEDGGISYLISTADRSEITRQIFTFGHYEEALMRRALDTLSSVTADSEPLRDRVFVDVGANIGSATLCALLRFGAGRAIALEPEPGNVRLLRANLALNGVDHLAEGIQAAVSDAHGELSLERSSDNIGDHRIRVAGHAPGAFDEQDRTVVRVPTVRLEDVLARHSIAPSDIGLVWIDVQGHEAHVLDGMPTLLDAEVPLVVEYWPYGLQRAGKLERIHELVGACARVFTLGTEHDDEAPREVAPTEIAGVGERLNGVDDVTNLLLLPRGR